LCEPAAGDGVVFFNPPRDDLTNDVEALLAEATRVGAVLLPIALDPAHRRPPGSAGDKQSFDVTAHLRCRELQGDQSTIIGAAIAREALAMTMPTFVQSRLRLFLCHRRDDGEDLAAQVDRALVGLLVMIHRKPPPETQAFRPVLDLFPVQGFEKGH
jgi:hypothetical protein